MINLTMGCTSRPYASLDLRQACEHIAAAGYRDVALFSQAGLTSASSRAELLSVRRTVEESGLVSSLLMVTTHLDLGPHGALADFLPWIDHAVLLGAKWLLSTGTMHPEAYDAFFALMRGAAPYAERAGVMLTLKPHGGLSLTSADLVRAVERVGHPAFRICYDPGNIIYYTKGEERPETHVAEVAPIVSAAIIKDCVLLDGKPDVMVTPGEGLVDFRAVLGGLIGGGFRGPLYLETVGGQTLDDIDENVRRSEPFIEGLLADVTPPA